MQQIQAFSPGKGCDKCHYVVSFAVFFVAFLVIDMEFNLIFHTFLLDVTGLNQLFSISMIIKILKLLYKTFKHTISD